MTVPVQTPINTYTYAGSAVFVYSFQLLQSADLLVTVNGATKTAGVDYTVAGVGVQAGGTVTFITSLTTGQVVSLSRQTALSRSNDYQNEGDFLADTFNADFDRMWMALQERATNDARSLRAPAGETLTTLPAATARANLLLSFDTSGNPIVVAPTVGTATALSVALANGGNGTGADLVGGVGRVVNTIAALKALLKTGVGRAFVQGYYAAGDGGGGHYYYDSTDTTSTDNGGTIIVAADGGRWKLVYNMSSLVSVKQFGAKGDGATDDAPAFTAALAWARDTTKLITVPNVATYYNLNSTVSFPGHTANAVNATSINYGVRLLGLGGGGLSSRPKIQGNIAGFLFNLGGSDLAHVTYSDTLENLYFGNFSASASSGCVKLGYVWDCTLKDCRFGSAGVNVDLGAWTMSSRFDNVRQDGTGSVAGTATTVAYGSLNGGIFTGAWAVTIHGGSIFNCQYGFRGYGDITQSGRMDIEHVNVIFNFVAEGPYVFDVHIEDFDCLFTNDQSVYPAGFASAGGSAGTGDCMFTLKGSFSTWRGVTSPIVIRPLTAGRQFLNLDDTFNKGGPYSAHNLSGAWNAVTDMTNGNATPCVVSLKRTSPIPDFATTGWKPNYGTARTTKYAVIDADRAETSGQFRLEGWTNRLQTEQVLKANFTPNATVNVGIANGQSFSQGITATGARPGDFVRVAFLNNAGTGGLPNGVGWSYSVTANDTVVVNFVNNSGALATVFGTTYVFVDPHDPTSVD